MSEPRPLSAAAPGAEQGFARTILLNPGPVVISDRVRRALAGPDLCHREPEFEQIRDDIRRLLLELFAAGTGHEVALLTGSGTAAVEAMLVCGAPPSGTILVLNNGIYGRRMLDICRAHGIPAESLDVSWNEAVPPDRVRERLRPPIRAIAMVHHETTTGLVNPVAEVASLARERGLRLLVDSVSGLAGETIDLRPIDFVAGTATKCIQGVAGLAFVFLRREALAPDPRSVYLDLRRYLEGPVPFTPAVQVFAACREALLELREEGVETRIARYRRAAGILRDGFQRLGLTFHVPAPIRSNTLTSLHLPPHRTYSDLHDAVKASGYVIYAGQQQLASRIFRVANMGWLMDDDLRGFLAALEKAL